MGLNLHHDCWRLKYRPVVVIFEETLEDDGSCDVCECVGVGIESGDAVVF